MKASLLQQDCGKEFVFVPARNKIHDTHVLVQSRNLVPGLVELTSVSLGSCFGDGYRSTCFGSQYRSNRRRGNRRFFKKKIFFFQALRHQMQDDGGEDGQQVGKIGVDISSTPSGHVDLIGMLEGEGKKKLYSANFVLHKIVGSARLPPEDLPHRTLSSVGLRFCFFGQFSIEGTEVKSASVTQTEVEL